MILAHDGIARGQLAIEAVLDPMILGEELVIVFGGQSTKRDQLDALHLDRSAARVVGVEADVAGEARRLVRAESRIDGHVGHGLAKGCVDAEATHACEQVHVQELVIVRIAVGKDERLYTTIQLGWMHQQGRSECVLRCRFDGTHARLKLSS